MYLTWSRALLQVHRIVVQGYLAHNKVPSPLELSQDPMHRPGVGS